MVRVSVVVPSFNNEAHIQATLESILAQTLEEFELIVADHSSTDATWDVLEQFTSDSRLTLLRTEPGGGALRNWNRVSQAASGEFLKLVCGDDLLHPDALRRQVEELADHPSASMAASSRRIVDSSGEVVFKARGLAGLTGLVPGGQAVRRCVVAGTNIFGEPACVLMRRSALAAVGWWNGRFPYVIDQATYTLMLGVGDFVAVPAVLADFRLSNAQWSVQLAREQHRQVSDFHRWVGREFPDSVSARDVQVGNLRAWATALGRRAVYWGLSRRMG